jgi:hypothetical protein
MNSAPQPYRQNPFLRFSYTLIAPLYDLIIEAPMRAARKDSLAALPAAAGRRVLVSGAGTGLDAEPQWRGFGHRPDEQPVQWPRRHRR